MIAYKGFHPGLICRNYQFVMGLNVTDKANCAANGFHCAENPLDCLTYYPNIEQSEYCLVDASGDVDEDGDDSKIACTELAIVKKLKRDEFFLHALAYMVDHPGREWNSLVQKDKGCTQQGFAIVRGADPVAMGKKGDILAFAKESPDCKKIIQITVTQVDGEKIKANVWYDANLTMRKVAQS